MKRPAAIIIGIIVYLVTTVFSYVAFSKAATSPSTGDFSKSAKKGNDFEALVFNTTASKTQACPLNGTMYSNDQKKWWETHRPLGVMIENHREARPQSGLSFADVVYESVAEGGITRFLAVFYCQDGGIVGPVRSARTYFMDYISEYGQYPLYAHVGGANTEGPANALGQIGDYGWNQYNDMNQFSIGFPTFKRDESRLGREVATEHTMYSIINKLWEFAAAKRKLTDKDKDGDAWDETFVPYEFKDDAALAKRPAAQAISIDFWDDTDYAVQWIYRKDTNEYARKNGGTAHVDRNTNKQIATKNLVVLFMKEAHANDGYEGNAHMLYGTKGTGKALIFMDGQQIKGTWKKKDREGRTVLLDASGEEIKFNRGQIWFEIQPLDGEVVVK